MPHDETRDCTRYCEVALPVPLRSTFTYALPAAHNGTPIAGHRVLVPFRNRSMIGVAVSESAPREDAAFPRENAKQITAVMDALPALPPKLLDLGCWIGRYYLAPVGEVFRAMLPPEIELRRERAYVLTHAGRAYLRELAAGLPNGEENTGAESAELALLSRIEADAKPLSAVRLRRSPGAPATAEALVRRGLLALHDGLRHRKSRAQKIVAWNPANAEPARDSKEEVIREILTATRGPLPLSVLIERSGASRAVVERLEKSGRLLAWEEPLTLGEDPWDSGFIPPANILNAEQNRALAEIWRWTLAGEFTAGLLHGVTGSGKTEVYLGAIEAARSRGRTALLLVPEIALTLWLGRLVRARFGESVAVLHSALPDAERAREWWRVRRGEAQIVVGTRSAVFAPLENLGLIIVDEEQESSYKQEETPRYHGRDTAVYRARIERAVVLLGSATPSLETAHNARSEKYRLLELTERVAHRPL